VHSCGPELMTPAMLAAWLGVSTRTLLRWRAAGDFLEPVNGYWSRTAVIIWFAEMHAATTAHGGGTMAAGHMRAALRQAIRLEPTGRGLRRKETD
jgi:hypothetical protein